MTIPLVVPFTGEGENTPAYYDENGIHIPIIFGALSGIPTIPFYFFCNGLYKFGAGGNSPIQDYYITFSSQLNPIWPGSIF